MIASLSAAGILELVLDDAPLNEIGLPLLGELEAACDQLPEARGVLIRSALERGFSAGADLKALAAAIAERGHEAVCAEVRTFLERIHAVFTRLDQAPIPVVGAVHGVVFGGGFELALCCDVLVADPSARFAFPELRLGLIPGFGGLARLRRDVGSGVVRDLLLTGRSLNAQRARELGIVSQVVGAGKASQVAARCLEQILKLDPHATRIAKQHAKPHPESELRGELETFCRLFARPEVAKALAAFAERTDVLPYLP